MKKFDRVDTKELKQYTNDAVNDFNKKHADLLYKTSIELVKMESDVEALENLELARTLYKDEKIENMFQTLKKDYEEKARMAEAADLFDKAEKLFSEKRFAQVGSQEKVKDPIIIAKFFNPTGAGTWYATKYDHKDQIFFGYVSIFGDWNDEWGDFSLDEIQNYRGRLEVVIERDLYFEEQRTNQVINKITERG